MRRNSAWVSLTFKPLTHDVWPFVDIGSSVVEADLVGNSIGSSGSGANVTFRGGGGMISRSPNTSMSWFGIGRPPGTRGLRFTGPGSASISGTRTKQLTTKKQNLYNLCHD